MSVQLTIDLTLNEKPWRTNAIVDLISYKKYGCIRNCRFDFKQKNMGLACNCRFEFIPKNMGIDVIVDLLLNEKFWG